MRGLECGGFLPVFRPSHRPGRAAGSWVGVAGDSFGARWHVGEWIVAGSGFPAHERSARCSPVAGPSAGPERPCAERGAGGTRCRRRGHRPAAVAGGGARLAVLDMQRAVGNPAAGQGVPAGQAASQPGAAPGGGAAAFRRPAGRRDGRRRAAGVTVRDRTPGTDAFAPWRTAAGAATAVPGRRRAAGLHRCGTERHRPPAAPPVAEGGWRHDRAPGGDARPGPPGVCRRGAAGPQPCCPVAAVPRGHAPVPGAGPW